MSKKSFEDRVVERKTQEARAAFAGYVQSVAFNMTLSRNMVDMLGLVRDFEHVSDALAGRRTAAEGIGAKDRVASYSVPLLRSLTHRGLVIHNPFDGRMDNVPSGWRFYQLTRAGELMCGLLVEAGLLSAAPPMIKKKRA